MESSPAVVDGMAYVGSQDSVVSSPAVANGVVYVGSDDGNVHAIDAAGVKKCASRKCHNLWIGDTQSFVSSSPAVNNGWSTSARGTSRSMRSTRRAT